jgi:hypothetical protein
LEVVTTIAVGDAPNGVSFAAQAPATPAADVIDLTLPEIEEVNQHEGH